MTLKYFTPRQVSLHNNLDDIWVSFLGDVYNLTTLCAKNKGDVLLKPILEAGGSDISHWFDTKTKDIRRYIDPFTHLELYYTPHGRFVNVPPAYPTTDWCNDFGRPWWKDLSYVIGKLTNKTRQVQIFNTLTGERHVIEVCAEDTLNDIMERYLGYNTHCASYTWKHDSVVLDMNKTLVDNNIVDDDEQFYDLRIDDDRFMTTLHIYYNDDLTEA